MGQSESHIKQGKYENNINYISNNSSHSNCLNGQPQDYSSTFQNYSESSHPKEADKQEQLLNTAFKWKFGG